MKFLLVFINEGLMHVLPVDFRHHDDDNDDDCFANMFETCLNLFQTGMLEHGPPMFWHVWNSLKHVTTCFVLMCGYNLLETYLNVLNAVTLLLLELFGSLTLDCIVLCRFPISKAEHDPWSNLNQAWNYHIHFQGSKPTTIDQWRSCGSIVLFRMQASIPQSNVTVYKMHVGWHVF